ncbi:MAG: hypothetical protein NW200_11165 [Hyphomonadaceae bacterium]|nr:hypothetical protein [Hyphomonadaceae bacterium]
MSLQQQVLEDRVASYARLRGGYSVPVAGAVYWAALGAAGYVLPERQWILAAFYTSGLIFPLALLLSKLLRNDFMKDRTATGTVLGPAFVGMLLFWPMAFAAFGAAPALVSLILAIGMSMHWPVIGWSYGRPLIYSAHAVVRAIAVLAIWALYPEHRQTWLPFAVAITYVVTIAAILIDSAGVRRRLGMA